LNSELALEQLGEFRSFVEEAQSIERVLPVYRRDGDATYQAVIAEMRKRLVIVEAIAAAVDDLNSAERIRNGIDGGWGLDNSEAGCQVLIGRVEHAAVVDAIVGPSGPRLAAAEMHPWIWNAAVDLWDDGHHRQAVVAASSALFDNHLPAKVVIPSARGGADLVTKAFSTSQATAAESRLRFPGLAEGTPEWTSAHEGAMQFGRGCAQGIRNVTTHGAVPSEQQALEALAALSLLARWIDEAEVRTT
jgi:hypothetical protein